MDLRRIGSPLGLLAPVLFGLAGPALAGGHHQTVLVPVQTVTAQAAAPAPVATAPVALAPTALVPVKVSHFHSHAQYVQVQTAAAPVQYVTTQAAAPVQYVTTQAAAPVQYVTMQAAAPVQYVQMQAAAPANPTGAGAAPVGAAPKNPAGAMQFYVNGVLHKLVPVGGSGTVGAAPAVGAAPGDDDGLSDDDRAGIVKKLAPFVDRYNGLGLGSSDLRSAIRSKAVDLYEQASSKDAASPEGTKAIDSIVDEALGNGTTETQQSRQTQQQMMMVPATSAAPMQLFLPVKVKHGHPFK